MVLPMSREGAQYERLKRSLPLFRMVFAQPRQEDLLARLEQSLRALGYRSNHSE
jgi:hypothetical protein